MSQKQTIRESQWNHTWDGEISTVQRGIEQLTGDIAPAPCPQKAASAFHPRAMQAKLHLAMLQISLQLLAENVKWNNPPQLERDCVQKSWQWLLLKWIYSNSASVSLFFCMKANEKKCFWTVLH